MTGGRAISANQRTLFLEHLAQTANVTASCQVAGFARRTAYEMRDRDPEFAAEFDDALEQATDSLEAEARRRAMYGVPEPLTSGRGLVLDPVTGQTMYVQKYSDTLMALLLKAHRAPKFAPQVVAATGGGVPAELQPDPKPTPDEAGPDKPVL